MAESVWDYPRPPRLEPTARRLVVEADGRVLADTVAGLRILETSHPPTYYIPEADIDMARLRASARRSICEYKGEAQYFDLVLSDGLRPDVAWTYPRPTAAYAALVGHLCFYAGRVDRCSVDGETVDVQPGDFYGGWITADLVGPFKGAPGTLFW